MPKFERAGSGGEEWVEPAKRRPRKGKGKGPKQDKGGRNAILLALNEGFRGYKLSARELSDTLDMPLRTVQASLKTAREVAERHKARRRAVSDPED
jgi:hypothetical protein